MKNTVNKKYHEFYQSLGFERTGLFELLEKEFKIQTVLYPGSSIHITPSFYFRHVVYVDKSLLAIDFFANKEEVSELISQHKTYKDSAYWHFINKDFELNLDLREKSFDLLISLFSGKLIDYCQKYVKKKGLILTNNLFSDYESVKGLPEYKLLSYIICKNHKYSFEETPVAKKLKESKLRSKNYGFEYVDNEVYYIYQKQYC